MTSLFLKVFNGSVSASYLILAVLLARLLLKKAPKWVSVALWAVVGLRLVCPISLESALSLIPSARTVPETIALSPAPALDTGFAGLDRVVNPVLSQAAAPQVGASVNPMEIYLSVAAWVWVMGLSVMFLYTVISYFRLDLKMNTAVRYWGNVYQSENVDSPFVLGLFRPRIYLPFTLDDKTMEHVIAHEQAHIRRRDHWWKPLGFALVSVHWFNPLMWLSYVLLCRDIELACDEKVIRALDRRQRADYSQALLVCSLHRRPISACPLAFGEVGVKDRVKSISRYRRPTFWILLVSGLVCALLVVCFLTNPKEETPVLEPQPEIQETTLPAETLPVQEASPLSDAGYYLELACPGTEFHPMAQAQFDAIMAECSDFLTGWELLARESELGSYILAYDPGRENGERDDATPSFYSDGLPDGRFLCYPAPQTEAEIREYENFMASFAAGNTPTLPRGYLLTQYNLSPVGTGGYVIIQPPDNRLDLSRLASMCLTTPGRTLIADAAGRNVWLAEPEKPFLAVYRIDPVYGELTEYIPLTEDLTAAILSQPLETLPEGHGFEATLYTDSEPYYYAEFRGVPQLVLDLAMAQCGYTFQSPEDITSPIVDARFNCPWLDAPRHAKEEDLPRLEQILKNARYDSIGGCGYGAFLHLTMADGNTLTVVKGTDGCDSIAFGSWGGYFLGDAGNREFWEIFGLDETEHLPLDG